MRIELEKIKEKGLGKRIQTQIKFYIINSGLTTGDSIPTEKEISEKLGISRTAIREALKGLEAIGIIEVRHGVGRFIREFDFEPILENLPFSLETNSRNYQEVLDLRVCLESHFLMKNLTIYTDADIKQMESALNNLKQVLSSNFNKIELVDAHSSFHCSLLQVSGNRLLVNLIKIFSSIHMSITVLHKAAQEKQTGFMEYHSNILEAIKKKDPVLLEQRISEHFSDPLFDGYEILKKQFPA